MGFLAAVLLLAAQLPATDLQPACAPGANCSNTQSGGLSVGTLVLGKQQFRLTEQIAAQVLASINPKQTVSVGWVGFDGSRELSMQLRAYLEAHGVKTEEGMSVGMKMPPLRGPIEINGNDIMVDASR